MEASLLSIRDLDVWYDRDKMVLTGFSAELGRDEVIGLIGLNGAGKTTFLKTLSGLLSGYRCGNICFQGRPAGLREESFKACRYTVFDEDHSFSYFTFWEYLSYVFAVYGKKQSDVSDWVGELIEGFHFGGCCHMLLKDLSTGNRKKAFLITAFALRVPLLLLDEPVNGLDFQSTEYLYRQISAYRAHGTVLFSSHILESITLTADRVLVLEDGRICREFTGGQINAGNIREALRDEEKIG